MQYNQMTRWLHAGIALGVSSQLIVSLIMEEPKPGRPFTGLGAAAFEVHEATGMFVTALLLLHWLALFTGHIPLGLGHLFPWFSKQRLCAVIGDARSQWTKRRLNDTPQASTLAGAVHGLGLLVTTLMAMTGATLFFGMAENGAMSPLVKDIKEVHEFTSNLLWAYMIGHVGVAVLHQWLGHRTLTEMFKLGK